MKLLKSNGYGNTLYFVYKGKAERVQDILDNASYIVWDLYPVAIWDYVDKDWSDKQGWLQELERGVVHGDMEQIIQYPLVESLEDLIEEEGYEIIDVDSVYAIEYMEDNPKSEKISIDDAISNALR